MKKEKNNLYCSDFETTTPKVSKEKTWVWAWCSINIFDDKTYYGNNISSFIEFCLKQENTTHYFHNLKFDGTFILDYLLRKLDMKVLKPNEKPCNNSIKCLINKMNVVYCIDVYFYKHKKKWTKVRFLDSYKILPYSVEQIAKDFNLPEQKLKIDYDKYRGKYHIMTEQEKNYIYNDVKIMSTVMKQMLEEGNTKITTGSNSLADFKERINNQYRHYYPVLSDDINEQIRLAYRGGYVYVNKNYANKIIYNGLVFDKNSMYPSHMRFSYMPYGLPKYFKGQYTGKDRFYIQHLFVEFKLKDGYVPTVQSKNNSFYKANEYIRETVEPLELHLTNLDLELLLKHYEIIDIDYVDGFSFNTNKGVFNNFIDFHYAIKQESKGVRKTSAKLKLNSLYGKFATNINVTGKIPELVYDKNLKDYVIKFVFAYDDDGKKIESFREPEYTALGVAITAYARYDLISIIDKLGGEKKDSRFVYCDTDSVHIIGIENPDFIPQDERKLNYWKKESEFIKAKFIRPKTYLEEIKVNKNNTYLNVKCAGMPKNVKKEMTFDNFKIGYKSENKLIYKNVVGGVLLMNTTFELKE